MDVRKKYFIFRCENCEKNIARSPKYHISKFSDLFNFCQKDLKKFALLLRKGVMSYECIDS